MAKKQSYTVDPDAPVILANRHRRLVDVPVRLLIEKLGTGVYDWPRYEKMTAPEVEAVAARVGVKYTTKDGTIEAIEERAKALAVAALDSGSEKDPGFSGLPAGRASLEHPNYALVLASLQRLNIID